LIVGRLRHAVNAFFAQRQKQDLPAVCYHDAREEVGMESAPDDGFIMPDGEFIALDDAERMYEEARKVMQTPADVIGLMFDLGRECAGKRKHAGAQAYFRKVLELSDSDDIRGRCLLAMGQIKEQQEDYAAAAEWYGRAFTMQPGSGEVWYFLHNNLGYCLNRLGRHAEALEKCAGAVSIDPTRHNAHKNLGVALEGLARFGEAALSYLAAAELCPGDGRALHLLTLLVASHPEVAAERPDLRKRMRYAGMRASSAGLNSRN
jgi:tetratricopeptide (TPR) repeat protein